LQIPPQQQERALLGIALADEQLHGVISLPLLLDGLTRVGAPQSRDPIKVHPLLPNT
jgi:hypothetical protein